MRKVGVKAATFLKGLPLTVNLAEGRVDEVILQH